MDCHFFLHLLWIHTSKLSPVETVSDPGPRGDWSAYPVIWMQNIITTQNSKTENPTGISELSLYCKIVFFKYKIPSENTERRL